MEAAGMRIRGLFAVVIGLILSAVAARADEITVVAGVLGPKDRSSWMGVSTTWRGRPARSRSGTATLRRF
jgi:hypothetical protein